jgi:hypothetical protein
VSARTATAGRRGNRRRLRRLRLARPGGAPGTVVALVGSRPPSEEVVRTSRTTVAADSETTVNHTHPVAFGRSPRPHDHAAGEPLPPTTLYHPYFQSTNATMVSRCKGTEVHRP